MTARCSGLVLGGQQLLRTFMDDPSLALPTFPFNEGSGNTIVPNLFCWEVITNCFKWMQFLEIWA